MKMTALLGSIILRHTYERRKKITELDNEIFNNTDHCVHLVTTESFRGLAGAVVFSVNRVRRRVFIVYTA